MKEFDYDLDYKNIDFTIEENVEYKNEGQVDGGEIDKKVKDSTDVVFWTGSMILEYKIFLNL